MRARIRLLLVVEAVTFALAAAVHAGIGVRGYEHAEARIAESIIAAVLAVGAVVGWWRLESTRRAALWAQGFALVATLVGVLTIVLGRSAHRAGRDLSRRHRGRAHSRTGRGPIDHLTGKGSP